MQRKDATKHSCCETSPMNFLLILTFPQGKKKKINVAFQWKTLFKSFQFAYTEGVHKTF